MIRTHGENDAGAWLRRLLPIEFNGPEIQQRIGNFAETLFKEEAEGILALLAEGYIEFLKDLEVIGDYRLTPTQQSRIDVPIVTKAGASSISQRRAFTARRAATSRSPNSSKPTPTTARAGSGRLRPNKPSLPRSRTSCSNCTGRRRSERHRERGASRRCADTGTSPSRSKAKTSTSHDQERTHHGIPRAPYPGAISGSGGHDQTFKVACALYNGWCLTEEETFSWLALYNQKCQPRWNERELKHKAASAAKAMHEKRRGYLFDDNSEPKSTQGEPTPIFKVRASRFSDDQDDLKRYSYQVSTGHSFSLCNA